MTRNRIAAIDVVTGAPTPWNPNADQLVYTIVPTAGKVYVGGSFSTIGGQSRNFIAALDAAGAATSWNPNSDSHVQALVVSGSTVYAAGNFTNIGGAARNRIAALNSETGIAAGWNPNADNYATELLLDGAVIYVAGAFLNLGAQPRAGLAAVDVLTGIPTDWKADLYNDSNPISGNALGLSGSNLYTGGAFKSIGGSAQSNVAGISTSTVGVDDRPRAHPATLRMTPNPTAGPSHVEYALPSAADIRLAVFDLNGRRLATLADGMRPAGTHREKWDGVAEGQRVSPGIYFVRLDAGGRRAWGRLVVVR